MVKTILLATDFTLGRRMLEWFDQADLAIKVAAWLYLDGYEDWRFAVASPNLDAVGGAKAYGLLFDALNAAGLSVAKTPPLLIFAMKHRFTRDLRAQYPKTEDADGLQFGSQTVGDRYVEQGILCRVR